MSPIIALAATPGLDDLKTPFFLERHLQELLSSIQKSTLDPPLTVSDLDPEILKRIKSTTAADDYYKTSLETAHKAILYDISVSLTSVMPTIETPTDTSIHRFHKIQTTMRR